MRRTGRVALLYRQTRTPSEITSRIETESASINTSALTIGGGGGGGGGANPTEVVDVATLETSITNAPIIENPVPENSATPTVIRTIPIPSSAKGKKCLLYGFLQLYAPSGFSPNQTFDYGLQIDDEEIKFGDSGITRFTQSLLSLYSIGTGSSSIGTGGLSSLQPISFPVTIPSGANDLKITIRNSSTTMVTETTEVFGTSTTYSYTGSLQTYTVPEGVNKLFIYLWGAGGGRDAPAAGAGAFVSGTYIVSPGQVLRVVVGRQGTNNSAGTIAQGGPGSVNIFGGHGGGFSGIFTSSTLNHSTLIACAGGGGCAGYFSNRGGSGGVINGHDTPANPPATGGTQTEGGLAGGTALQGGAPTGGDATGGGGGYYGGGGGRQGTTGGGGGSSYTGGFAEVLDTEDGKEFVANFAREPGGTTNQYYISPRGRGLQAGQVTIVQAVTRNPARINANIKFVVF